MPLALKLATLTSPGVGEGLLNGMLEEPLFDDMNDERLGSCGADDDVGDDEDEDPAVEVIDIESDALTEIGEDEGRSLLTTLLQMLETIELADSLIDQLDCAEALSDADVDCCSELGPEETCELGETLDRLSVAEVDEADDAL